MLSGAITYKQTEPRSQWRISSHFRRDTVKDRPEATKDRLIDVLENWAVRCITVDRNNQEGLSYWGWVDVDGSRRLMQVVTSPSGEGVIESAYLNRKDRRELERGNIQHFRDQCARGDLEVR